MAIRAWQQCIGLLLTTSLLGPSGNKAWAADGALASEFRETARRCRQLLESSVIDFYLPACIDKEHGGYLEALRDGKFSPIGEKFLTLQGRQLWFFSTLAREGIKRDAALAAARNGYAFLQHHFLDPEHGGYFSKVTDAGAPLDRRKHVYLNAFALYGLVAYHRASGDSGALDAAKALFRVLDAKAYDRAHGGYTEFFNADWQPIADPKEPRYVGDIGTKTYNTHLHVLEALADLYRVWPDPLVARRLHELICINRSTVQHPVFHCNIDGWRPDWHLIETPDNLRASYGHDVECAWLTLDAAQAVGMPPAVLRSWAEDLCGYSLRHGYDRQHGGFFYTGPLGKPADNRKKEWWVEAEALVSMLEMYRLTGDSQYLNAFRGTFDFVVKHQIAREGSWWASCTEDGKPIGDTRTSPWQGAYHNGRSMLRCAALLDALAEKLSQAP